ncbi:MAG: ATP-binding protein, partial [Alphaproteobacteria bacterium]|nr:ATP-binding protein [Alphaproteobacteria bacterium]
LAYHGARAEDGEFNVTLERHHDSAAAPLEVMPQELTRVLLNLIGNGFHAVHKKKLECGDPAYEPTLRVESREHGDRMEITIHDNGPGIAVDAHSDDRGH